ncbi:MAG: efflux RND transporter permease subunit [candidate division WOR-3 bacterium]
MHRFTVSRPVSILMIYLALFALGLFSLFNLRVDLLPKFDYPMLKISIEVPPSSPDFNEKTFTETIENKLRASGDLVSIYSLTFSEHLDFYLVFSWGQNMDLAYVKVKEALLELESTYKEYGLISRIEEVGPHHKPYMILVTDLENEDFVNNELYYRLCSLEGVSKVEIWGISKCRVLNYKVHDVFSCGPEKFKSLIKGIDKPPIAVKFKWFNEVRNVVFEPESVTISDISRMTGVPLYLSDKKRELAYRNGKEVIVIKIYKRWGYSPLKFSKNVKQLLARYSSLSINVLVNRGVILEESLRGLIWTLILAIVLTSIATVIFLKNFLSAVPVIVALGSSCVLTLAACFILKVELNLLSLGGIILSVGMLVDASIIVLESVAQSYEEFRKAEDAVIAGVERVKNAVIASIITNFVVFLPALFLKGVAGKLLAPMAIVITMSLLISLVVSFTLTPVVTLFFANRISNGYPLWFPKFSQWLLNCVELAYKRKKAVISAVIVIISISAFVFFIIPRESLPPSGKNNYLVKLTFDDAVPEREVLYLGSKYLKYSKDGLILINTEIGYTEAYLYLLDFSGGLEVLESLANVHGAMVEISELGSIREELTLGQRISAPKGESQILSLEFDVNKLILNEIDPIYFMSSLRDIFVGFDVNLHGERRKLVASTPSLDELRNFLVKNVKGKVLPLKDMMVEKWTQRPSAILRENGVRVESFEQISELKKYLGNIILVAILAILFVYMAVAAQYDNLKIPFIMYLVTPASFILIPFLLILFGKSLNLVTLLGFIISLGVSINDSIVVIDFAEQICKDNGKMPYECIVEAIRRRLRTLLMTTFTTVLALIPLSLGIGPGGTFESPMALAVIGGIISADLVTLFVLPIIYVKLAQKS